MTRAPALRSSDGYPPGHSQAIEIAWKWAGWSLGVTGILAALSLLAAFWLGGSLMLAAVAAAVFLFALLTSVGGIWSTYRHVRIIPFYERRVGETDTFLGGQALARQFQNLGALAMAAGVPPLSDFGFPDPLRGETVVWNDAAEGLWTVRGLITELEGRPGAVEEGPALLADLRRWEAALARAEAQGIRFSLLVLHGNTTSGLEWERRGGDPF